VFAVRATLTLTKFCMIYVECLNGFLMNTATANFKQLRLV